MHSTALFCRALRTPLPDLPDDYGELLKPIEPLKSLADRFSALSYQTDAHAWRCRSKLN
jgi:hypothetical protein